ncbi:DUF58 domain-containing protein [Halorubrum lipolyticum]|uniref:DUF58 domain-containing protein n=1 Tax=Halorubrum lipolyticum DSM 21995 TaxID=1227482 RepID=M0NK92_9EURY|nr:DUF58 domain-containing protein [Halorubrum lipolyticum]EMA58397.1 hypothetical protein C469_13180 [Halorubrum lipolyticum DSM 21995]
MEVTDRWWATAGSGVVLVVLGVLTERPILLLAGAGLGAWLLGVAGVSSREFTRLGDRLEIAYALEADTAIVGTTRSATLAVRRPTAATMGPVSVRAGTPPGVAVDSEGRTVELGPDETTGETTFDVEFPVAGRFVFPSPRIRATDPFGLYRVQFTRSGSPTATVRAETLDIRIGRGGRRSHSVYGQHRSTQRGPGVTTHGIREYTPTDDLSRIDWKTTARLATAYVRETERETDRRTVLIVDHRGVMAAGDPGETMLDYAREVATSVARTAFEHNDPIGLYTTGDQGLTETIDPGTTVQAFDRVETRLYELVPTDDPSTYGRRSADRARRLATRIEGDDSRFARVLTRYVGDPNAYVRRTRGHPLVGAVRAVHSRVGTDGLLVIVASDHDPAGIEQAVKSVVRAGGRALVMLTPRCLFDPTDLTDLDDVYERYRAFERFRRELDAHPRVTVLEIAPGTRLDAVLTQRRADRGTVQ